MWLTLLRRSQYGLKYVKRLQDDGVRAENLPAVGGNAFLEVGSGKSYMSSQIRERSGDSNPFPSTGSAFHPLIFKLLVDDVELV